MGNDESKRLMSREEELQQAADEWAEFYKHAEDVCDYISVRIAYNEGAAWADKHPKNVWHDVSEEPRCEELLLGEDSDGFSIYRWCGQEDNWEAFVNATGLSRWAYIADLLS